MEHLVLEQGHRGLEIERLEIEDARGFGLDDDDEEEEEDDEDEDDDHQHKRIRTANNHHNHNRKPEDGGNDTTNGSTMASYVGSPSTQGSQSQVKPEAEEMVIETMKPFHDPRKKVQLPLQHT